MVISVVLGVVALIFILRRVFVARKPVYLFKTNIFNDRTLEWIILIALFSSIIFSGINQILISKKINYTNFFVSTGILVLILVLTIIEYNFKQIGIYENGIIIRSQFHPWKKIYTYRTVNMEMNKVKLAFYFYDGIQEEKLNISYIYVNKDEIENILNAIGNNLDPTKG